MPQTSAESTTSPSLTTTDSSSTFANDPLLQLLQPKALHLMTPDEAREEINKLRSLRTNAHSLGKALREGAAVKASKPATQKQETLDDLLGKLGV